MKTARALLAALFLVAAGGAARAANPPGTSLPTTTVVVDGISTGTVKLTTYSVTGLPSYATRAKVKGGAYFDLVPATGSPADGVTIVDAPDGRQWTIVQAGGGGGGGLTAPVLNTDLASMANGTTKCRTSAGTGSPEDCTPAQERAVLGLAAIATSGSASDIGAGTLAAARLPAFSGGTVTGSAGTGTLNVIASGVTAATYGDATHVAVCTFGADGRATSCSSTTISVPSTAISDSTVLGRDLMTTASASAARTSLGLATVASTGSASDLGAGTLPVARLPAFTGGDATSSAGNAALTLVASGVTAATYGSATQVAVCAFDSKGRATNCSSTSISVPATAISDSTTLGRALVTAASASAARSSLGLVIGTDVQAQDAELAALAGLTSAADTGIYFTGSGTAGTYSLTSAGRTWVGLAGAAAQTAALNAFVGSGAGHLQGLVPDPGASAGTTRYLREDGTWTTPPGGGGGGGDALTTNPLSQFAATTSAQLAGVLTDETGSGLAVFGTNPTFAGYNVHTEIAAPASPSAGVQRCYVDSTSHAWSCKQSTGTIRHDVLTFASVSNQFLTSVDDDGTFHAAQPAFSDLSGSIAAGQIASGTVTDAKLANMGALSVKGRSANSSGVAADIAATGASDAVLRENGSTIGFGTVATGGIANDAITNAKAANMATSTIKGRVTAGTGDPEDLTPTQAKSVLAIANTDVSGLGTMSTQNASAVAITGGTITGLGTPSASGDAATKGYVDGQVTGLQWKPAVRVATTTTGTLATAYENGDTVDGVTLATGDRILLKDQSTASENGIYVVAASGAPARASDADAGSEFITAAVKVTAGTANAGREYLCTNTTAPTLGSTSITWANAVTQGGALMAANNLSDLGSASTARTNLGLATVAASGSATDLGTGTLPAGRLPALTGDVTSSVGSAATTLAAGSASVLNSGTLPAGRLPALTGDVTSSTGSATTTLANIPSATPAAGSIVATNIAAPSSPASGKVTIFSDSTDLRFHDKNASGVIGTTVVADTGASNQFLTAISAAGAISKAQPSFSNLSGSATTAQLPTATNAQVLAGSSTTTVTTPAGISALFSNGTDNSGGATITLGDGRSFNLITSTTAITAFAFTDDVTGRQAVIRFNTSRTLTHNATSLVLPTGANITTNVGDLCQVESRGSGNFRVNWYTRADGTALTASSGPPTGTAGGDLSGTYPNPNVANLPAGVTQAGRLVVTAIAAPSTPGAGTGAVYVDSTSKNISVKDDAGTVKHGVQTNTGSSNQWVSAIADNGAVTTTQPALTNLSSGTSADLAGVLSDETGSGGGFVRATSPTITTPTLAGATMSGALAGGNNNITGVKTLGFNSEVDNGNKTGASQAIADFTTAATEKITLTGNVSSSSWTLPGAVGWVQLKVCQDGTGSRTLTWPSTNAPTWTSGAAPVLQTTASACDLVRFYYDGTTMWGSFDRENFLNTTGTAAISQGGTGQTTAAAAHDALTVKSSDVASASTTDLCAAGIGIFTHVTGTTTINNLGTCAAGVMRVVEYTGATTVTHNATSLINLTAADRKTAAGDMAVYVSEGSGNWREVNYAYVQPDPLGEHDDGNSGTAQTIDFSKWRIHKSTLTGNVTYTFTAPARASNVVLHLVEDGTGGRTITLPASVKWTGGTTPTWVTTASAHNVIACYTDATNYYCSAYTQ